MHKKRSELKVVFYLAFLQIITAFGVDSSLPAFDEIRPDIGLPEGSNQITLLITVYLVGVALGLIACGPFADRFGRVPSLRFGLILLIIGALGSILSQSLLMIIIFRFIWGIGASFPSSMRLTVARDLYSGDAMARVASKVMAVFLLGPIISPLASEGILTFSSWRVVYSLAILLSGIGIFWSSKFGETLEEGNKRPLNWNVTSQAFKKIVSTRVTMGYVLAVTFGQSSFFIWLGNSQPIFDSVYDRDHQFALIFSLLGIPTALAFFTVNIFIKHFGAKRVAVFTSISSLIVTLILFFIVAASNGIPDFWVWLTLVAIANIFSSMLTPIGLSLALEPMDKLAGTASGVAGAISLAGGALFGALIGSQIVDTVTPMAVGYLLYSLMSLFFVVWSQPRNQVVRS